MYRPKKRQLVRRVAVTSSLALVGLTGLGVTFLSQSGATSSALNAANTATTAVVASTTKGATTTLTIAAPKYHIVGGYHDDSRHSGDGSQSYGDN
ncbi:MAG: hypothetical protein HKL85_09395 [Acidimicrobiaceae bacterium]|nr:hypothetical protein [Acidimicrobiaceae bacterium]